MSRTLLALSAAASALSGVATGLAVEGVAQKQAPGGGLDRGDVAMQSFADADQGHRAFLSGEEQGLGKSRLEIRRVGQL